MAQAAEARWAAPEPTSYSIGEVLEAVQADFPALTISKLRYLEDQGLLRPARTASGFRRYTQEDIDRLRYALTLQRDTYMPLKAIRGKLAALDAAGTPVPLPGPRAVRQAQVEPEDVATVTGQDQAVVEAVARAAGLSLEATGAADAALVQAVEAVVELAEYGLELRHLRPVFQAAARQADLVEVSAQAIRGHGSAGRERAATRAAECAAAMAALNAAVVRLALAERDL
ncbi:MAG: MerR family transcriptional regulator [Bifidobacteriaceae bacterium]|jgi:DNA-binding transcriptional MerR regulator|nr:MerR family transcriptional regulator [Bifidobacteriaceae bacterium]